MALDYAERVDEADRLAEETGKPHVVTCDVGGQGERVYFVHEKEHAEKWEKFIKYATDRSND